MSVVIVVAITFLIIGVYLGEQHTNQTQTVTTVYKTLLPKEVTGTVTFVYNDRIEFINNITMMYIQLQYALDTARATFMFIDEHSMLESYIPPDQKVSNILKDRRVYFSDRTIDILDLVIEKANSLKPVHNVSETNIKMLQEKLTELHQLAVQLRTIAYKDYVSGNDVDQAKAILENMQKISNDIYDMSRELIKNA